MSDRHRNWFITSNVGKPDVSEEKYTYCLIAEEHAPTTGKLHFHMYIEYKDAKTFKKMTKTFKNMRCEPAKGNAEQQKAYLSKENLIFEDGTPKKQGKRNDLLSIKDEIDKGADEKKIAETYFPIWVKNHKAFNRYIELTEPKRDWVTEVYILKGKPGLGKSRYCYERGAVAVEYQKPFFLGYNGEDVIVFEEFDWKEMPRETFLKICDRYPMRVPIKGGERNWKPKCIYFTTNDCDPLGTWYKGDAAFLRRVKLIDLEITQKCEG